MNVLITGGTGFIGSQLALTCLARGDRVRCYAQENTPAESENRQMIEAAGANILLGSMTEDDKLREAVDGVDVVFHLAAAQHEANVPDQVFWDVNFSGTQRLLAAGAAEGIKRFVHGSTIGVYGSALGGTMDERSPLKPDNIYGRTKLAGEQAVLALADSLPLTVIRISETYGPGDRRLLKLFKGIQKKAFLMVGAGDNIHHLIYIEDLIDGFLKAAASPKALGEVFVLAGKEPLTTNEMVKTIARTLDVRLPPIRMPLMPFMMAACGMEAVLKPLGIQPPLHRRRMDFFKKSFLFSQEKARRHLNFTPQTSFHQGVVETAQWYREKNLLK